MMQAINGRTDIASTKETSVSHGHVWCCGLHLNSQHYTLFTARSLADIDVMSRQWEVLSNLEPAFGYFQSYEWCKAWADTFVDHSENKYELRVYILERDARPALVWPMMIVRRHGLKVLTAMSEPLGQYSNILADESLIDPRAGYDFLLHIQKAEKVDALVFGQYPEGSFLDRVLGDHGFMEIGDMEASIATLNAFEDWDEYQASLNKRNRSQRNKRRNKLDRQGAVEHQAVLGGTPEFDALISEALVMKAKWLEETGRSSESLLSKQTETFLKALKGHEAKGDMPPQGAVAHVLRVDGKSVGIELGMTMGRHYYSYLGAFDWAWKDFSVGKIQIEMTQKWAMEAGIHMFDFLGDPSAYKSNWTQTTQSLKNRNVPLSIKGFLYVVIWRCYFRPIVKKAYAAMGANWRKKLSDVISIADRMRAGKTVKVTDNDGTKAVS